jgi:hypothetical protein
MLAVERRTAAGVTLAAMRLPAPETTPQIIPTSVAWISEKNNPALSAVLQVGPQVWPLAQQRPNLGIVRPHQLAHLVAAVPTWLKLEMPLNFGCYKPRL